MSQSPITVLPSDELYFGRTAAMQVIRQKIEKVANTDIPLLFQGENGTGKEVLARLVHARSIWAKGTFVKVNCAAIPGTLLESELFGHEKGAFTGGTSSKPGRIELAHNGTLFLDEIADLEIGLQGKLLHFIQDGSFSSIGGEVEKTVKTRIISATNRNLTHEIDAGTFRADLYYRISVLHLRLPPLRDRQEDIPGLVEYFCGTYEKEFEKEAEPLGRDVLNYLKNLVWPGNIRELSNVMARYVLIGAEAAFAESSINVSIDKSADHGIATESVPLKRIAKEAIRECEWKTIRKALCANQWNRRRTAQALKISYRTLLYKIREAGLVPRRKGPVPAKPRAGSIARSSSVD